MKRSINICHINYYKNKYIDYKRAVFNDFIYPFFLIYLVLTSYLTFFAKSIILYGSSLILVLNIFLFIYENKLKASKSFLLTMLLIGGYLFVNLIGIPHSLDGLTSLKVIIKYFWFFAIIYSYYRWIVRKEQILLILNSINFIGAIIAISIVFNGALIGNGLRQGGIISNSNNAAFLLYMCWISTFIYDLFIKKRINHFLRIVYIVIIVATLSRSALLCVFCSFMVILLLKLIKNNYTKRQVLMLHILIIFILAYIALNFTFVLYSILRIDRGTTGRNYLWIAGLNIWNNHKLWGIGLGNIPHLLGDELRKIPMSEWQLSQLIGLTGTHSIYIDTLVQGGIMSLMFLLIAQIKLAIQFGCKIGFTTKYAKFSALMFAIILSIGVRGFFEPAGFLYCFYAVDIFFWIFYVIYLRTNCLEDK